jgi:hypothetical protein
LQFWTANAGTLSEKMRITEGGNVGIGTTSPSQKLHVIGNALFNNSSFGTASIRLLGVGASTGLDILADSNDGYFWNRDAGNLYFGTNNTERMQIDFTGNINFRGGTTAANAVYLLNDSSLFRLYAGNTSASIKGFAFYVTNGSTQPEAMRITSGGNVLIGTTSDAGARLRVAGNLLINGFQRMYTYLIVVNPNSTGTVTISSPTGTNMQGTMQVMAGGYGNGLTGNITGLWMVGGLLFFDNASTSTITQIVNSVTNFGSMSFQRSGDQYTVTLTNTASSGGSTKSLYVSVIINGD